MRGEEAVLQCACHACEPALLGKQQGDLVQGLGGQGLELFQGFRKLFGGRVIGVAFAPGLDVGLLIGQGGRGFGDAGKLQPAVQVAFILAGLQLADRKAGHQRPDRLVVFLTRVLVQQRVDEDAFAGGGQGLSVCRQGLGFDQTAAGLLFDREFTQAFEARMPQRLQCNLGLVAG
ncbi:hypothetical protein D3C81_1443730 [compost metagenome]